jgi:anti-sigma factor RsiW
MNGCPTEEQLALHAGDDLEGPVAADLRRHLPSCARCRRLLQQFRASQAWLASHREAPVDAALLNQLQRRLGERLRGRRPPSVLVAWLARAWESTRSLGQPFLGMAVAACLIVAAVTGSDRREQGASGRAALGDVDDDIDSGGGRVGLTVTPATASAGDDDPAAEILSEPDEAARLRIELSTTDPDVRIIWFASRTDSNAGGR